MWQLKTGGLWTLEGTLLVVTSGDCAARILWKVVVLIEGGEMT